MLIIRGKLHGMGQMLGFMLIAQEMFCIFLIHVAFVRINKNAYWPGKVLLSFNAHNLHRAGDFRAKLKLSLEIDRLHTRKQIGITYGGFATVKMETFVKVLFI